MRNSLATIMLLSICVSDYTLVDIDASSYTDWVYFSFSNGEIVNVENPENSNEWDLGLMRNHFRTNSGLSGSGFGGAYVDSTSTWTDSWDSVTEVPNGAIFSSDGMLTTIYDLETHEFSESPGSIVLESWGWVDIDNNYQFNYNNYIFIVRTSLGEYVKFWPYSYYSEDGSSGHVSIAYEVGLPNNNCESSGDVNYDGILNILDIVIVRDHILETHDLSNSQQCEADINLDSYVDLLDIVIAINIIFN